MSQKKKQKLELHTWYKTRQGTFAMLVLEYPWYHFRRLQGWRFRDDLGFRRTKAGRVRRWPGRWWGDIILDS